MEKLSHTLDLTKRVRADAEEAEEEENYINIVIKERQQQRAQITNVKILY